MKYSKTINGNYTYSPGDDTSKVEIITGSVDCSGADTKTAFPRLTSVGGSVYCSGADTKTAFPRAKLNDSTARGKVFAGFLKSNMLWADNILANIISKKKNVYKIVIVGQTKTSYCIMHNNIWSHGETIKKAKADLIYKIGNRDTSKYKPWKLNTVVSLADAIESYRVITGACEIGTKNFCSTQILKKQYSIKEIISITAGQYGNESYADFFVNK